ncbi:LysR family transcriptional regulator [Rhodovulum sp. DZ06]|uniref:LysR family transcriptional regulator n=1 Tax=Rhodovulum sp. DZ06 TaxID=3425126 RepID=UPI003D32A884
MTRLPPLAQLRAFEAAARLRSFSEAGRELNVSHAAISQQVRKLEEWLNRPLMRRAGRGLALTPDGAALAQGLSEGFDILRDSIAAFAEADAAAPVNLTMTPNFAMSWLMPRLARFRETHPEIELRINPTGAMVDMTDRSHDLAIRYGRGGWAGVESEVLAPTRFLICAAPELAAKAEGKGLDALAALPWLQELDTDEVGMWMREERIDARPAHVTSLPGPMLMAALRDGQGLASVAEIFVMDDIAQGRLKVLHEGSRTGSGYHLVRRPGPLRPPARALADWLREEARADPALQAALQAARGG